MIRYQYQNQIEPPAPFVLVTIRNLRSGAIRIDVPGQLDTGADRTVVTEDIVIDLALPQTGSITVEGVGGVITTLSIHRAEITLPGQSPMRLEVATSAGEPWILLGRDILNGVRVVLDGPQLILELG